MRFNIPEELFVGYEPEPSAESSAEPEAPEPPDPDAAQADAGRRYGQLVSSLAQAGTRLGQLEDSFEGDPDHLTIPGRFRQGADGLRDEYASRFDHEPTRDIFLRDFDRFVEPKRNRIERSAFGQALQERLDGLKSEALRAGDDEDARLHALRQAASEYRRAAHFGHVEDAGTAFQDFLDRIAAEESDAATVPDLPTDDAAGGEASAANAAAPDGEPGDMAGHLLSIRPDVRDGDNFSYHQSAGGVPSDSEGDTDADLLEELLTADPALRAAIGQYLLADPSDPKARTALLAVLTGLDGAMRAPSNPVVPVMKRPGTEFERPGNRDLLEGGGGGGGRGGGGRGGRGGGVNEGPGGSGPGRAPERPSPGRNNPGERLPAERPSPAKIQSENQAVERAVQAPGFKNARQGTAEEANKANPNYKDTPPYTPGTVTYDVTLARPTTAGEFVRVTASDKARGQWILRKADIKGLTPQQIKEKFDLGAVPTSYTDVTLPADTTLRIGSVNRSSTSAVQYEIVGKVSEGWFSPLQDLSKMVWP